MILFPPGGTSKSVDVQIVDDSGQGVTGLVASTFPPLTYKVAGANAAVAFPTLTDLALITTAWSAGGVKEISGGYYRLDVPDALFAAEAKVRIIGEVTGKHVLCETIQVGYPQVDARQWLGGTIPAVNVTGVPLVDTKYWLGTVVATPSTAGIPSVDLQTIKGQAVACAAGVTVLASLGTAATNTAQTGDNFALANGSSGFVAIKGNTAAIVAKLPANNLADETLVIAATTSILTAVGTPVQTSQLPTNFAALGITAGGKISGVVLADTVTTYTGNTPQTGDNFARIGAAGAGLTALGDVRLANLDVATSTRLATAGYTAPPSDYQQRGVAVTLPYSAGLAVLAGSTATSWQVTVPSTTPVSTYVGRSLYHFASDARTPILGTPVLSGTTLTIAVAANTMPTPATGDLIGITA